MSLGVGRRGFAAALSLAVGLSAMSPWSPSSTPWGATPGAAAADEGAGCLPDVEPNDRLEDVQAALEGGSPPARGAFCAAGTLVGADQDIIAWEVSPADAGQAWSLTLAGVPGALTASSSSP